MKVIILAAGVGKRLGPLTNNLPKPLIKIDNKSLLEHILSNLNWCGIKETTIVTGYKENLIRKKIGDRYLNMEIDYVHNPIYNKSGHGYSLWLAKEKFNEDIIFMDADILFNRNILKKLIDSQYENALLVKPLPKDPDGEEVKVIAKEGLVQKIGKEYDNKNCVGEAVGIFKLSKKGIGVLIKEMNKFVSTNRLEIPYEDCIQKICDKINMNYVNIGDLSWIEIDFIKDLKKAKNQIYPKILKEIKWSNQ